jgi:hypothetical protein
METDCDTSVDVSNGSAAFSSSRGRKRGTRRVGQTLNQLLVNARIDALHTRMRQVRDPVSSRGPNTKAKRATLVEQLNYLADFERGIVGRGSPDSAVLRTERLLFLAVNPHLRQSAELLQPTGESGGAGRFDFLARLKSTIDPSSDASLKLDVRPGGQK